MESNVTLLNFDGAYTKQSFYRNGPYNWIELESMPNTNLFCEKDNLRHIDDKLLQRRPNNLHFIGSGNYHYISYVLQSRIEKPYTLILFDHHTDTLPSPSEDLISCGSWVLNSLQQLPMLQKVFIIGAGEDAPEHIPSSFKTKAVTYEKNLFPLNLSPIIKSILNNIPTDSVYVSIDKDVLDKKDAVTGWDHGTLRLKQMMKMVKAIFRNTTVIGTDICGEYPVNPANEHQKQTRDVIETNNRTNRFILECIKRWAGSDRKTSALLNA
ncbi:arginase family protein [Virgibacillus siamensis]|uniref:arginase family protein n=1 Tax=Virgibacillus siamensis TaxID=480071 RepID=UPI000985D522|nr:arginase family protein [Virgibacillus siamensis]